MRRLPTSRVRHVAWSVLGLLAALSADRAVAAEPALVLTEPPAPQPGECWTAVAVPAVFEPVRETVELQPARTRREPVPAQMQWVERTVQVPAARRRVVVRPAEVTIREERVLVHPQDEVQRRTPARYRSETVRVPTARTPVLKPNAAGGAVCVVEVPGGYREETRRVQVAPARSEWVERAPQYRTVRHRTVLRPAETALREIPAHTEVRRERVQVAEAGTRDVAVAAVTATEVRERQTAPARLEWRAVLCGSNAAPPRLAAIQQALQAHGQDPGRTDGQYVEATTVAMRRFETEAGLAPLGFTVDALRRLGLATP